MHKKEILVVEDEGALQKAIEKKLIKNGFKVVTAKSAAEAKEKIREHGHFDGVWLDHYLYGEQTGLEVLREVKQVNAMKFIPTILVSNTVSIDKVQRYMQAGLDNYYIKSNWRLDNIIKELCGLMPA